MLNGELLDALKTARAFHAIWRQNSFTPEGLNLLTGRTQIDQEGYPLRPELIESIYYLSRAFPYDSEWLHYGKDIMDSINKFCRTVCVNKKNFMGV